MAEEPSEVERILAENYGQGFTSPALSNYQADPANELGTQVTTPEVTGLLDRMYSGVPGMLRSGADMVRGAVQPWSRTYRTRTGIEHQRGAGPQDNMLAGGLDTAANWINGTPQVGPDTLAPLGLAALGMNFAVPGAAGIFGGRLARTADQAALARAEEMAARGVPRDHIWSETGWFRGPDGLWRFEIDDSRSALNPLVADQSVREWRGMDNVTMDATLQHPDLYAAYPDLASIRSVGHIYGPSDYISGRAREGTVGQFGTDNRGRPIINTAADDPVGIRSAALHELQHAAQDVEGHAPGGSPQEIARGYMSIVRDAEAQIEAINEQLRSAIGTPRYNELLVMRDELSAEVRRIRGPDNMGIRERSFAEYRLLPGEREARNTQRRADMTPVQRWARPPWRTED